MASPAGGRLLTRLLLGEADPDRNPFRVFTGDRGNEPDRMVL